MVFSLGKVPVAYLLPFLVVSLFTIQLGVSLGDLPSLRLLQDIICKQHFGMTSNDLLIEERCRIQPVQKELNVVNIGMSASSTVAGVLVAIPFGMLSDRIGRVPVLVLSLFSIFLAQGYATAVLWQWKKMPLRAIWAGGAALVFGGGRSVAEAMIFAMLSDVVPARKQATQFQWIAAAVISSQTVGPIVAGRMMAASAWTPLCLSLFLILLGGCALAFFTPETLSKKRVVSGNKKDLQQKPASSRETMKILFTCPAGLLLPGTILAIPVASIQSDILLRLMPVQFDWPLSRSALLVSLRSLVTLLVLIFVLPGISYLYHKTSRISPLRRDRALARGSAVLFAFGSLCLLMISEQALVITGIAISALGSGTPTLCRAMLVGQVSEHNVGSMFGVLAIGEILGFLFCELVMGWLFDFGLRTWMGLPLCFSMMVALAIGIATWLVRVPQGDGPAVILTESDGQVDVVKV